MPEIAKKSVSKSFFKNSLQRLDEWNDFVVWLNRTNQAGDPLLDRSKFRGTQLFDKYREEVNPNFTFKTTDDIRGIQEDFRKLQGLYREKGIDNPITRLTLSPLRQGQEDAFLGQLTSQYAFPWQSVVTYKNYGESENRNLEPHSKITINYPKYDYESLLNNDLTKATKQVDWYIPTQGGFPRLVGTYSYSENEEMPTFSSFSGFNPKPQPKMYPSSIPSSSVRKDGGSIGDGVDVKSGGTAKKIGDDEYEMTGKTHEEGGIKVNNGGKNYELEHGETVDGDMVFSDTLSPDGIRTFADIHKDLLKKKRELKKKKFEVKKELRQKYQDKINDIDHEIHELFEKQQEMNGNNGEDKMELGGVMDVEQTDVVDVPLDTNPPQNVDQVDPKVEKRRKLYNNLTTKANLTEKELGTFDVFSKNLDDRNRASKLYNNLTTKAKLTENELGTEEQFLLNVLPDEPLKKKEQIGGDVLQTGSGEIQRLDLGLKLKPKEIDLSWVKKDEDLSGIPTDKQNNQTLRNIDVNQKRFKELDIWLNSNIGSSLVERILTEQELSNDEKINLYQKVYGRKPSNERLNSLTSDIIKADLLSQVSQTYGDDIANSLANKYENKYQVKLGENLQKEANDYLIKNYGEEKSKIVKRNQIESISRSYLSEQDKMIADLNGEYEKLIRLDSPKQSDLDRLSEIRTELGKLMDSPQSLYDPKTGDYIPINEATEDVIAFNDNLNSKTKEYSVVSISDLEDLREKAYFTMVSAKNQLDKFGGKSNTGLLRGGYGQNFDTFRDRYENAKMEFMALNKAIELNQDPGRLKRSVVGEFVTSLGRQSVLGEIITDGVLKKDVGRRDVIDGFASVMDQYGIPLSKEQKDRLDYSIFEKGGSTMGTSLNIAAEIAFWTAVTKGVGNVTGITKNVKLFKDIIGNKYGKTAKYLSNLVIDAAETGAIYGISDAGVSTGVGESVAQNTLGEALLNAFTKGKGSKLYKFVTQAGSRFTGEFVGEYFGDFVQNLTDNGFNISEAFYDAVGHDADEVWEKAVLMTMTVLPFTGATSFGKMFAKSITPYLEEEYNKNPNEESLNEALELSKRVASGDPVLTKTPNELVNERQGGIERLPTGEVKTTETVDVKPKELSEVTTDVGEVTEGVTDGVDLKPTEITEEVDKTNIDETPTFTEGESVTYTDSKGNVYENAKIKKVNDDGTFDVTNETGITVKRQPIESLSKVMTLQTDVESKVITEPTKKQIVSEKYTKRKEAVRGFVDKLKGDIDSNNGILFSTPIPPPIIKGAIDILGEGVVAGLTVAETVENAVNHIREKMGDVKFDEEKVKNWFTERYNELFKPISEAQDVEVQEFGFSNRNNALSAINNNKGTSYTSIDEVSDEVLREVGDLRKQRDENKTKIQSINDKEAINNYLDSAYSYGGVKGSDSFNKALRSLAKDLGVSEQEILDVYDGDADVKMGDDVKEKQPKKEKPKKKKARNYIKRYLKDSSKSDEVKAFIESDIEEASYTPLTHDKGNVEAENLVKYALSNNTVDELLKALSSLSVKIHPMVRIFALQKLSFYYSRSNPSLSAKIEVTLANILGEGGSLLNAAQSMLIPEGIVTSMRKSLNNNREKVLNGKLPDGRTKKESIKNTRSTVQNNMNDAAEKSVKSKSVQGLLGQVSKGLGKRKNVPVEQRKSAIEKRKNLFDRLNGISTQALGVSLRNFRDASNNQSANEILNEIAKTYIEEGVSTFDDFYRAFKRDLKTNGYFITSNDAKIFWANVSGDDTQFNIDKYSKDVLKESLSELGIKLLDIVKQHSSLKEAVGKSIVDSIEETLGLTTEMAQRLADAVMLEYESQLRETSINFFAKELGTTKIPTKKSKSFAGKEISKLIELINAGILDEDTYTNLFGDRFGFKTLSNEDSITLNNFANDIREYPEGSNEYKKRLSEFMLYIDGLKQKGFSGRVSAIVDVMNELFYVNALSGFSTIYRANKGVIFTSMSEMMVEAMMNPKLFSSPSGIVQGVKAILRGSSMSWSALKQLFRDGYSPTSSSEKMFLGRIQKYVNKKIEIRDQKDVVLALLNSPLILPVMAVRSVMAMDALIRYQLNEFFALTKAYNELLREGMDRKSSDFWKKLEDMLQTDKFTQESARNQAEEELEHLKQKGLKHSKNYVKVRTYEIMEENRPESVIEYSNKMQSKARLMQYPVGTLGLLYTGLTNITTKIPLVNRIIPFMRVPTNALDMWLDWSPYGFKRAAFGRGVLTSATIKDEKTRAKYELGKSIPNEERIRVLIKATMSTLLYSGIAGVIFNELMGGKDDDELTFRITSDGADGADYSQLDLMREKGWKPYMFMMNIGGRNVSFDYRDTPMAMMLSSLGKFMDNYRYGSKEYRESFQNNRSDFMNDYGYLTVMNSMFYAKEQSYVKSMVDFSEILSSRNENDANSTIKKFAEFTVSQMKSSVYPNLYKQGYLTYKSFNKIPTKAPVEFKKDWQRWFTETLFKDVPYLEDRIENERFDKLGHPVVLREDYNAFLGGFPGNLILNSIIDIETKSDLYPEWKFVIDNNLDIGDTRGDVDALGNKLDADKTVIFRKMVADKIASDIKDGLNGIIRYEMNGVDYDKEVPKLNELTLEQKQEMLNLFRIRAISLSKIEIMSKEDKAEYFNIKKQKPKSESDEYDYYVKQYKKIADKKVKSIEQSVKKQQ